MIVWRDGAWRAAEEAEGLADRGLLLGDGAFETFRIEAGRARRWPRHFARLQAAAAALGLRLPQAVGPGLGEIAAELAARNGLAAAAARLTLSRGQGPRGLLPPTDQSPHALLTVAPVAPPPGPRRIALSSIRLSATAPSHRLKTLSRVDHVVARSACGDADDALLLSSEGAVASATAANIFWVHGSRLYTPSLHGPVLAGVTRAVALACAAEAGLQPVEGAFPLAHLAAAEAAFLTSSLIGVVTIAELATAQSVRRFARNHEAVAALRALEAAHD